MIKKKQTALFSLKIIYFYLILIIAIITLGLAGFCFYYYKNSLSNTKNIIHQLTSSAARQIDLQISSMDNLAQQLVSNKALIQTMGNLSNTEKRRPGNSFTENYVMANQLSTLLQQTCLPGPLMERISVANDQGDYLAICSNYKFLDSNQEYNSYLYSDDFLSLYKTIKQKEIIKFTAFSQYDKWLPENNIPIISCYRPITDIYTFQIHGILEIQRPFTIIENILKNINYSHIQVYLFDDSNQMIYQNLNAQKAAPLTSDTIFDQNGVNTQFQQQYPFSDYSTIEGANWKLISILPISSVAQPIINVIAIVAFILAFLIIFVLITVATVEKNIRIPLGNLKNSLSVIDIDNLDINFDSKSAELEQIHHVFLEIIRRLKDSIEKKRISASSGSEIADVCFAGADQPSFYSQYSDCYQRTWTRSRSSENYENLPKVFRHAFLFCRIQQRFYHTVSRIHPYRKLSFSDERTIWREFRIQNYSPDQQCSITCLSKALPAAVSGKLYFSCL